MVCEPYSTASTSLVCDPDGLTGPIVCEPSELGRAAECVDAIIGEPSTQNFNVMFGFDEAEGIDMIPMVP